MDTCTIIFAQEYCNNRIIICVIVCLKAEGKEKKKKRFQLDIIIRFPCTVVILLIFFTYLFTWRADWIIFSSSQTVLDLRCLIISIFLLFRNIFFTVIETLSYHYFITRVYYTYIFL